MTDLFSQFNPKTFKDIPNAISLRVLGDGPMPCNSQAGETNQFGQVLAPVNLLAGRPALNEKVNLTQDIFGPLCENLQESKNLQESLANKLFHRMDVNGSLEYGLIWKQWDIPAGPPICALRVLKHRISDKDYSGWPTPTSTNAGGRPEDFIRRKCRALKSNITKVTDLRLFCIQQFSNMAQNLTELNPAHSRWLMGFPLFWDVYAPMATPSSRKSRRSSSKLI